MACGVQCTAYRGSGSVFFSQNLGRLTISNLDGVSSCGASVLLEARSVLCKITVPAQVQLRELMVMWGTSTQSRLPEKSVCCVLTSMQQTVQTMMQTAMQRSRKNLAHSCVDSRICLRVSRNTREILYIHCAHTTLLPGWTS